MSNHPGSRSDGLTRLSASGSPDPPLLPPAQQDLENNRPFLVWPYSAYATAPRGPASPDGIASDERTLTSLSLLPYESCTKDGAPVSMCAFQGGVAERKVAAHVSPTRSSDADFAFLRAAGIVPHWAHEEVPANILSLSSAIREDLDAQKYHLLPSLDLVLHRLVLETLHFSSSPFSPDTVISRPPFSAFYEAAEEAPTVATLIATEYTKHNELIYVQYQPKVSGTTYRMPRLWSDILKPPILPPLVLPISTNLLIYSMRSRILQSAPVADQVQLDSEVLSTAVRLLLRYWNLGGRSGDEAQLLVAQTRSFILQHIPPTSPFHLAISSTAPVAAPPPPPLPLHHHDVRGVYTKMLREDGGWEVFDWALERALREADSDSGSSAQEDDWPRTGAEGLLRIDALGEEEDVDSKVIGWLSNDGKEQVDH